MPVFHIRTDRYDVPGMQHLCWPALFLVIPFTAGDKQDLAAGMFMPVVPCTGSNVTLNIGQLNGLFAGTSTSGYTAPVK